MVIGTCPLTLALKFKAFTNDVMLVFGLKFVIPAKSCMTSKGMNMLLFKLNGQRPYSTKSTVVIAAVCT